MKAARYRVTDVPIEETVMRHIHTCRRLWNEFLGLLGKKHYAYVHGERETVEALDARMATVSSDLEQAEAALKRADYVEEHPADWRSAAWAKALLVAALLGVAGPALAQTPTTPSQRGYIQNQSLRSVTVTPASITIAAVPNSRVRLYGITASCTGGGFAPLLVLDGSTQVFGTDASYISANTRSVSWPVLLTGGLGNSMFVQVGSCAQAGSIGQIYIQLDQWGP